jgi:hypothetical protein
VTDDVARSRRALLLDPATTRASLSSRSDELKDQAGDPLGVV